MIFKLILFIGISFALNVDARHKRENEIDSSFDDAIKKFPKDFLFGASTAAYQIEGAWNVDGRGPCIWDDFVHKHSEKIADHSNGDVGANSYDYFEDDIKAIKSIGMDFYRFSISWSRVLPTADPSNINEAGIEYYNKVINKCLEYNIQPMVTMYHYDLPSKLQVYGGLTNSIVVRYFEAYAKLLFKRFGDRVKHWITFNEPAGFCTDGYGNDVHAPAINEHGIAEYLCAHNVLKSHALAYHLYKDFYYEQYKGQVGITLNAGFSYSDTNDTVAIDRALQFTFGWFAHPIFSTKGNYPSIMIEQIASNSRKEKRSWSRLPKFSKKWIDIIRGSADFLGLNYYTSRYVEILDEPEGKNPSHWRDMSMKASIKPEWKRAKSEWLYSVPSGLGDLLRWIKKEYKNPAVIVTENGWSDDGDLNDVGRIDYLREHMQQMLDVVLNDECDLKAYIAWSIIDNFEWARGYTEKFGMFAVNMSSPRRERTPRKSSEFMRTVVTTRYIPEAI